MAARALRKVMVAFAAFDSVAACRPCATQNASGEQPENAPDDDAANRRANTASPTYTSPADASPEANT
jgi:hypothetical protein